MTKIFDATEIQTLVSRLDSVAAETGNCGRKVRRTLDQLFPLGDNNELCVLTLPVTAAALLSGLQRMRIVGKLDTAASLANSAMEHVAEGERLQMALSSITEVDGEFFAGITFTLSGRPDGVKAQQQLLSAAAYGLRRIVAMSEVFELKPEDLFLGELFFDSDLSTPAREKYRKQAEALASGDFTDADATPMLLVAMGERLAEVTGTPTRH